MKQIRIIIDRHLIVVQKVMKEINIFLGEDDEILKKKKIFQAYYLVIKIEVDMIVCM